jgi:hypothetical protein
LNQPEKTVARKQRFGRLNPEKLAAVLHKDPKAMARLWSDDFVVTNPLNKFVNKQQLLGMVDSGFLVIVPGRYSFRSATTGSTRMARSAGR